MEETLTGRQMCETIVRSGILNHDGMQPTAREIWDHSPTEDLYAIPTWYVTALLVLGEPIPERLQNWMDMIKAMYDN